MVCDASNYAIGCALMQFDDEDREQVVSYQSRQLKPAERNYPVHDKELLAMRYALIKFRVYLFGEKTFALYTDHASLRTATKSPHLSQRMARWLSLFTTSRARRTLSPTLCLGDRIMIRVLPWVAMRWAMMTKSALSALLTPWIPRLSQL